MIVYYVLANIDNNPTVFKVDAKNVTEARDKVNEYCVKRYAKTSIKCYAVSVFMEDMAKATPHAVVKIKCEKDTKTKLIELSDINEYKDVVDELKEEHYDCTVRSRLVFISEIGIEAARFYQLEKGYDLEKAIDFGRMAAERFVDLTGADKNG